MSRKPPRRLGGDLHFLMQKLANPPKRQAENRDPKVLPAQTGAASAKNRDDDILTMNR
jgi:hypothetical protein